MFDTTFLHTRNVAIHTQRCTFRKDNICHLALCVLYEDKLLGGLVGKGLDLVSHIVVLWKDALDGICLISGCLAVQFNLFTTVKQGDEELTDTMRQDMAQKYYMEASNKPEMKVDLFKSNVPAEEVKKIQRVNIFKTKETDNQPSVILCMPTVNGEKLKPREISPSQWQRMWLAENMQDYKKHLAASLFADVLRKDRTDAVAVGTEKSEQEAQSNEVKQNTAQQEEDKATEEQKEETPEKKEQKQKEEKAKEEKTKAETKAAVVAMTPMLKQFYELKGKHPDAVLLFRCGDFYETYCQDAEKASKILGITLTKSSHTKDADGKPLAMAGFPYHALDTYRPKLIRAGERVAICDQLEAPKRATEEISPSKVESPQQEQNNSSGIHR